jgi:kumamolisin
LDVQTIGACCASSNTLIILYVYPNSFNAMYDCVNTAINNTIIHNGVVLRSSVISISWGATELYFPKELLDKINNLFKSATDQGINVFCASGDFGSTDGINDGQQHLNFPSSSPNVTSCGGTSLQAINNDIKLETVWIGGGGGYSDTFPIPDYQKNANINTTPFRASPDLVQNADPNTGCQFLLNNKPVVYGGTSMVSPALAGYIASIKLNKFLNPIIYKCLN